MSVIARARRAMLLALALLIVCSAPAIGQDSQDSAPQATPTPLIRIEEDPTKPVFFSLRNEYRNLSSGAWANTVIFRIDQLKFRNFQNKGGAKGLIFRLDVPLNIVHVGSSTQSGLGDVYMQALYLPRARRKQVVAIGAGAVLPTATDRLLGKGKFIIAPTLIPLFYFSQRKRLLVLRAQNFISIAGKSDRPDVNYLLFNPIFVHRIKGKWWMTEDNEFKWDWNSRLASVVSGIQVGRMIQGKLGIWVKPEVAWGPGRSSNFNLKFTVFRVR